jgi:hypothetical protein
MFTLDLRVVTNCARVSDYGRRLERQAACHAVGRRADQRRVAAIVDCLTNSAIQLFPSGNSSSGYG